MSFTGIGKLLTLKLIDAGASVIAVSRTQSDLDALKKAVSVYIFS